MMNRRMDGQPRSNTPLNFFKVWAMKNNLQGHKCSYRGILNLWPLKMYNHSSFIYESRHEPVQCTFCMQAAEEEISRFIFTEQK